MEYLTGFTKVSTFNIFYLIDSKRSNSLLFHELSTESISTECHIIAAIIQPSHWHLMILSFSQSIAYCIKLTEEYLCPSNVLIFADLNTSFQSIKPYWVHITKSKQRRLYRHLSLAFRRKIFHNYPFVKKKQSNTKLIHRIHRKLHISLQRKFYTVTLHTGGPGRPHIFSMQHSTILKCLSTDSQHMGQEKPFMVTWMRWPTQR